MCIRDSNDIIDIIADQYDDELNNPERKWLFKCIAAHEGPLSTKHPNYNGSKVQLVSTVGRWFSNA